MNLGFAIVAAVGAAALLRRDVSSAREPIDVPGTLTATAGLFALVYGFAYAQNHSWGSSTTIGFLAAGALLLAVFVAIQMRAAHPLMPLRVVLDRDRGGSYLALGIAGLGLFGVFLSLTYYLQQTKGYSPIRTGVAFLPLAASLGDRRRSRQCAGGAPHRSPAGHRLRDGAHRDRHGPVRAARRALKLRRGPAPRAAHSRRRGRPRVRARDRLRHPRRRAR